MNKIIITGLGAANETFTAYDSDNGITTFISEHNTDVLNRELVLSTSSPSQNKSTYGVRRSKIALRGHEVVATPDGEQERLFDALSMQLSFPANGDVTEFHNLCKGMSQLLANADFVTALVKHGQTNITNVI